MFAKRTLGALISSGGGAGPWSALRAAQKAIQAGSSDSQYLRGADAIAAAGLKHTLDVQAANFFQRHGPPRLARADSDRGLLKMFGQVVDVNEIAGRGEAGAGDYIFKFADIAGPRVLQQNCLRAASEPANAFGISFVVFLEKKLNQEWYVLKAFGQTRHSDLNRAQSVVEVFTEKAG